MFKILIVEDELYARESLVKQVKSYDTENQFEILQADNGKEGEEIYQREEPELVMTDIRMPKMSGLELLESIREKDSRTQVVVLSAYSEFEYARLALMHGAADYLLKPIEEKSLYRCLDKFVRKKISDKKEALMIGRDIVTQFIGNSIHQEGYGGFVEETMFHRVFPAYQVTVVWFQDRKPDLPTFMSGLENIYGSAFFTQFRFLEPDFNSWVLVVNPTAETSFFQRRIHGLLREAGCRHSMGVGFVHTSVREVGTAYQEAWRTLQYKIYGEEICFADKIRKGKPQVYYLNKEKEDILWKALQIGNEKKADECIRSIFEELRAIDMVKAECLELLYTKLTSILGQTIEESGWDNIPVGRKRTGILRFNDLDEMECFFCNISRNLCRMGLCRTMKDEKEMSINPRDGGRKEVVEIMSDYVREHYQQDISLKELAERVLFMNQDYLSYLFAEKKGISFSAYVKRMRMERAKELLQKGNRSVTEVATMTGYNDTSQFIRFFKQETGMTPKKYQMKMQEKEGGRKNEDAECK